VPKNVNLNLFNNITVSLSESVEYAHNDKMDGLFKHTGQRKELIVGLKVDVNKIRSSECKELVDLFWYLSMLFENILE
jgi:hypothetical protein